MAVLNEGQRRKLEKTVERAREVAELGARAAIEQLAVHRPEPFANLSADERDLRNRLRARARQLGDKRDARSGDHQIDHLVVECAYEHWHRMLFARFLAENNVLMHPDGVAVTLEECEELAPDEGAEDGWELAAWYAAEMLPQIFRPDAPVLEVKLPPERQRELERLLADLPPEVFKASDSLGWVYQFWQAKKKDEVNKNEVKIGADELPAVTQLFTEPYMVQFLLHNTLGAWWVGRHGRESLPIDMPYLRFLDDGMPAAGTFDGWPDTAAEIKVLDPCCGSGHFLVAAFEILVHFRMAEEKLKPAEACDAVLRDNIHGLEIDERCTQIAAFALALAAWTFPGAGGYRVLPEMHIACSGLAPRARKNEWLALARDDVRLRNGMERLYELFQDAPVLGSLISPRAQADAPLLDADYVELEPVFRKAVETERARGDHERYEEGVTAQGINTAARLLSGTFHLVATNVPYLGREKQSPTMRRFAEKRHSTAKHDLATIFLTRILEFLVHDGAAALVLPQYWLFLSRYKRLRKELLRHQTWNLLATLGPGAFETITGEVVNACLVALQRKAPADGAAFAWLDASKIVSPARKASHLMEGESIDLRQGEQLRNPDSVIGYVSDPEQTLLSEYAYCYQGLATSDNAQFVFAFWEVPPGTPGWHRFHFAPGETRLVSGCSHIIYFEDGYGRYYKHAMALKRVGRLGGWKSGHDAWGRRGVAINRMGDLPVSLYLGEKFDCNVAMMIPRDERHLPAIFAYCSSAEYAREVRRINKKLSVTRLCPVFSKGSISWSDRGSMIEGRHGQDPHASPFPDRRTMGFDLGLVPDE